jgi:hypothetical protein
MTYRLSIQEKSGYLHAVVTGQNTKENVAGYLEEIRRECAGRHCYRVLIEERLDGPRLGLTDVFAISSRHGQPSGRTPTIAYVDVNAQGTTMAFAENVAVNRGISVRVFGSVQNAEQWLKYL